MAGLLCDMSCYQSLIYDLAELLSVSIHCYFTVWELLSWYLHRRARTSQKHTPIKPFDAYISGNYAETRLGRSILACIYCKDLHYPVCVFKLEHRRV